MNSAKPPASIRKAVLVPCSIEQAFRTWTEQINLWWPKSHSRSGDPSTTVHLEQYESGRIFERTPEGTEYVWGMVIEWDPPRRFSYHWYLGSSPDQPTRVDVYFTAEENGTRVQVIHRGPEFIGDMWTSNSARYDVSWDVVLPPYVAACSTQISEEQST